MDPFFVIFNLFSLYTVKKNQRSNKIIWQDVIPTPCQTC